MQMHQPTRRIWICVTASYLGLCSNAQSAPPVTRELRLSCNPDATSELGSMVLRDLYLRIGVNLTIVEMPAIRASVEARAGRVDGEVLRARGYGDNAPMLIRVEPAIYLWRVFAQYKRGSAVRVHNLTDLSRYAVGYVRGIRFVEELVKDLSNTVATDNPAQLVKMLQTGRIDVALAGATATRPEFRALGMTEEIVFTMVAQTPTYHYLHEKNRELVPMISAEIARAAASGELERLYSRYEKQQLDAVPLPQR